MLRSPIFLSAAVLMLVSAGRPAADRAVTGLLAGHVVDATTGAPLSNAIVSLSLVPGLIGGRPLPRFEPRRVLVDRDGSFVFSQLASGTYALRTEKRGYAEGAPGRLEPSGLTTTVDLSDGQIKTDLVLGMWKHAAIEGRVVDASGEPAGGIKVFALRRRPVAGHSVLTGGGSAMTDDRGVFRAYSLEPGDYVVFVPSVPTSTYQALFYPASPSPASADTFTLRAGEERIGLDMQLRAVSPVRVSGRLTGIDGPVQPATIRLVPEFAADFALDAGASIETTTRTDEQGNFTFPGTSAGNYEIKVETLVTPPLPSSSFGLQPPAKLFWASHPIAVGATDVANIEVAVRPGVRVSGRLEFVGGTAAPVAAQTARGSVWLHPATNGTLESARMAGRASIDASGRFATAPVVGGKYVLRVDNIGRWTMASAVFQGRDVADSPIDLTAGNVTDIVVTMTDRQTTLSGPVVDVRGAPDPDACVLIFPTDPSLWVDGGAQARRFQIARTDTRGMFTIDGAPMGEYFVVAVSAATAGDWRDPRVLDLLARSATRVRLADGERRTVNLKTAQRLINRSGNE
jgi:hypothetical protein